MDLMDNRPYRAYAIVSLIGKYWKLLLGVAFLATILAVIFFLITPSQYKSMGVVFPPQANDLEQAIANPQFGYDVAADRLIQLLESQRMRDLVVRETGLVDYYELDTTSNKWKQQLTKNYFGDVSMERTRYMSVVISAKFKDPKRAADVVNANIDLLDEVRKQVFHASLTKQYDSLRRSVKEQRSKVTLLGDSLIIMGRKPGGEGLEWIYTRLRFRGEQILERETAVELLSEQPAQLLDPRNELLAMNYVLALERMEHLQRQLARLEEFLQQPMPGVYVVDRAEPTYDPVSPSLFRNLVILLIGGMFIAVVLLMIRERFIQLAQEKR